MEDRAFMQELILDRIAAQVSAQAVVEGDAALPGSMRDAVTVLAVHAQAAVERVQAQTDQISVSGRVSFHVLYTQGDLTRIQVLEAGSDFTDQLAAAGVSAQMRATAAVQVIEASASASGGRLHLQAVVNLEAQATQETHIDAVSGLDIDSQRLRTKTTEVNWQHTREIGRERTLLREEFELGAALGVQQTLFATAQVQTGEIAGGEGKVSLTGVIDLCVYHAGSEKPLLVTRHAMPFETAVKASGDLSQDAVLEAQVTLRDVLADSMGTGDGERVLRVEVEIEAAIFAHETQQTTLLQDAYTLSGDALSLTREEVSVSSSGVNTCAKDSGKMMLTLPEEHPPVGTVLAAFATPVVGAQEKAGTQLRVDGVLGITVIYLPMDSGIPVSAVFSQPFTAGFETNADVGEAQLCCTEIVATGITSDRIEARYALQLCARSAGTQSLNIITQVQEVPAPEQSGGICVYFPGEEESLWDVARRYRVDETALAHLNAGREAVQPIVVLRRRHV